MYKKLIFLPRKDQTEWIILVWNHQEIGPKTYEIGKFSTILAQIPWFLWFIWLKNAFFGHFSPIFSIPSLQVRSKMNFLPQKTLITPVPFLYMGPCKKLEFWPPQNQSSSTHLDQKISKINFYRKKFTPTWKKVHIRGAHVKFFPVD